MGESGDGAADRPALGAPGGDGDGPRRRNPTPALLTSLLGDILDPGYQQAAARRGRVSAPPRRRTRLVALWYLATGVVAVGLVLGIAARATAASAPSAERTRAALVGDVHAAQQRIVALDESASELAGGIRTAQSALGVTGPLATVTSLEQVAGMTPVQGPGIQVVIDQATGPSGAGVVQDRDVQLLVNGLWSSGAEAVTVGGVRLRTTSSIRQAGGALLVDGTPVFYPVTVQAIGEPSRLHVALVSTDGFGRLAAFASLYGIRFDVTATTAITMPAAPGPDLHYASAAASTG